ncbi:uncharacterized protein LOC111919836 [Lactuca sativa]|uniref:uncharacterized protein LOC111919836 n=1 Tax=Lactuca sativa TaxID=4236 RepID=UPI000CD81370|nr:uncharacterized protein LOC111919836 [Lactuca sativa]
MDKIWTKITNKVDPKCMKGAIAFADMAKGCIDSEGRTHCPCKTCLNIRKHAPDVVCNHIIHHGFQQSYKIWTFHGESRQANEKNNAHDESDNESDDGVDALLGDAFHVGAETKGVDDSDETESSNRSSNPNVDKLFADMEKPLFPGCENFSVLGFILRLMHVKATCKMTNVSMDMILKLLSEAFKDTIIRKTHYEAKKYLRTLGLGYESIHACKNDCALFWKENSELQSCPVCGASRWVDDRMHKKKIPTKVLRYFPITSRLKRLYASRYTAKDMQWHAYNKSKEDGVLRYPADGKAWKHFNTIYPDFAKEPRNVRLGLASDDFNPFGTMSTSYIMWPVVLILYNLPTWKSLIDALFMMALLIPGKDSPGKDMDVYLRPLVDELKVLWEKGIETYDSESGRTFNMRATLMWTINDFPAYGYLSGWSTSGYMACPTCNKDASSIRIRKKITYVGHRRFLPLIILGGMHEILMGKKSLGLHPNISVEKIACAN